MLAGVRAARSTSGVNSVAFSSDNKRVVSAAGCLVKIWDIETGDEVSEHPFELQ